ncbi:MAG: hypothetical protein LBL49_10410 [Clostridiales Family XIII bacterium]|nr:hypothetical protein [Clostridiales Family XIII bacterium]
MKRKILVMVAAVLILAPAIFVAVSAADTGEDFSITLDRAGKNVTVTATGYAPNESVSLLAAYDAVPEFSNLDYIDQLKADEDGNLSITYPSRYEDEWLGGQSYYVALNGKVKSEALYATAVKANPSVRISVKLRTTYQLDFDIDGIAYEFTTSNASIAKVSESGLITPVRAGSAVITLRATDGSDLASSIVVSVTP